MSSLLNHKKVQLYHCLTSLLIFKRNLLRSPNENKNSRVSRIYGKVNQEVLESVICRRCIINLKFVTKLLLALFEFQSSISHSLFTLNYNYNWINVVLYSPEMCRNVIGFTPYITMRPMHIFCFILHNRIRNKCIHNPFNLEF